MIHFLQYFKKQWTIKNRSPCDADTCGPLCGCRMELLRFWWWNEQPAATGGLYDVRKRHCRLVFHPWTVTCLTDDAIVDVRYIHPYALVPIPDLVPRINIVRETVLFLRTVLVSIQDLVLSWIKPRLEWKTDLTKFGMKEGYYGWKKFRMIKRWNERTSDFQNGRE